MRSKEEIESDLKQDIANARTTKQQKQEQAKIGNNLPKTVVSPDVANRSVIVSDNVSSDTRVVIIPMAEWKQCAQRGVRSTLQAATLLLGGGTLREVFTSNGLPPIAVAGVPSTGNPFYDAIVASLLFGLLSFVWNFIEFSLDIDTVAPKWRA